MVRQTVMFDVSLTLESLQDTLYAIAIARTVASEDIDRMLKSPEEHTNALIKAQENRKVLVTLWESYSRILRMKGFRPDGVVPLAPGRSRSGG